MNDYQLRILNKNREVFLTSELGNGTVELCDEKLVLTENENYRIKKYAIQFMNPAFEKIEFKIGTTWVSSNLINFEHKYEAIKISFINGIADALELPIEWHDADIAKYDAKIEKQNRDELILNMNAVVRIGSDLVNIFWKESLPIYDHTSITLYAFGKDILGKMFMQKYDIEKEVFFKSISNLAYGTYAINITQFKANGEVIISHELTFEINPNTPLIGVIDKLEKISNTVQNKNFSGIRSICR